jgi:LPS export ABC transporter protein LptC
VVYFEPSGEKIHLRAERAFYDNRSRLLTATGNVDAESDRGYRFQTQTVYYNARDKQMSSQDKVTFRTDRLSIEGVGIDGSLRDQRFVLLSEVKAVFLPIK